VSPGPGQRGPGRLEPAPAGVGRRLRVCLGGQPGLPRQGRRTLHPRREAAGHQRRGRRGARPGRYHSVADSLRVKEVWVPARAAGERAERFTVCYNPRTGPARPVGPPAAGGPPRRPVEGSDAWPKRKRDEPNRRGSSLSPSRPTLQADAGQPKPVVTRPDQPCPLSSQVKGQFSLIVCLLSAEVWNQLRGISTLATVCAGSRLAWISPAGSSP
jgi:hypothetical protein